MSPSKRNIYSQNILIVVDESIKLLGYFNWQLIVAGAAILPQAPFFYTGESFCHVVQFLASLGQVHSYTGGAGIAFMRMIFIRYPNKLKFGQKATAMMISSTSLIMTAGLSLFVVTTPKRSQDLIALCKAESKDLSAAIFDYSSDKSIMYEGRVGTYIALLCGVGLVLSELANYTLIYKFLLEHEKTMILVSSESTVRSNIKKNAINLFGHTMNFAGLDTLSKNQ